MRWVDPAFSAYPLSEQYTGWIYGDPQSNPAYYDQPDKWPKSGYAAFQDREISIELDNANQTKTTEFDLTGGKNCVVFARYAAVTSSSLPFMNAQTPTQLPAYVSFQQRLVEGYLEVQDTALVNVFGFAWSPHTWPAPITWNDKLRRTVTVSVPAALVPQDDKIFVKLVWKVAYLNTGA